MQLSRRYREMHGRVEVDDTMVMPTRSPSCSLTYYLRTNADRRGIVREGSTKHGTVRSMASQPKDSVERRVNILSAPPSSDEEESEREYSESTSAIVLAVLRGRRRSQRGRGSRAGPINETLDSSTPPEHRETHFTGRSTRSRSDGEARRHARACVPHGSRVPVGKSFG